MNIKRKLLFFLVSLLMSFFVPNYANAAFTFSGHDTKGALLNFSNPVLIAGTAVAAGAGSASVGAKFKYTNVITVDGMQVDAIVSVDNIVNMTITKFDDPSPKPTPKDPKRKTTTGTVTNYVTSFGAVVPEGAIFAPQLTAISHTANAYVDFTISFQDTAGKPVVLQNVYNNSLDDESVEYNEFGGFNSFLFASDYKTNAVQHMVASPGLSGKVRFSNSNCAGNAGLYITDSSRVQTWFKTITSLRLTLGQFANGTVPTGVGTAVSTCTNTSVRYYGAIFVKDGFVENPNPPIEITAPTVNSQITSNTKPAVTGTVGGEVSAMTKGSPLAAGETLSVTLNGVTYTTPNPNLVINNINWTLNVPTPLAIGTYEVTALRTGGLIDQTSNELTIVPLCVAPTVLNQTATACVLPNDSDDVLCHTGDEGDKDGDGFDDDKDDHLRHYVKQIIDPLITSGHETHEHDKESTKDSAGRKCPDDAPICTGLQILDPITNTCVTPVAVPPTVDSKTTTDKVAVPLTGTSGTSSTLIITVKNSSGTVVATSSTVTPTSGSWTYTPPVLPAGTYNVVATGDALHGSLTDSTTGELVVTATVPPTVASKTTNDKVAVPLTGTSGTSATLVITVKNSSNVIVATSATVTPTSGAWTYTPPVLPAGTYDVIATGDAAHGSLVDSTTGELVVTPTTAPTVDTATFTDQQIPTVTGTTGTSAAITVTVNGVSGAATVTGTTWSYTLPAKIAAGSYNVTATGSYGLVDSTTNELTITATVKPTVANKTTDDRTAATLTGNVGTSTSLTIQIKDGTVVKSSGTATLSGTAPNKTWSYTAPILPANGSSNKSYEVIATGETGLVDISSNELTVTPTTPPTVTKINGNNYTSPTAVTTTNQKPVLFGNAGTSATVTVTVVDSVSGAILATSASITPTGTSPTATWSFTPTSNLPAGTYDIKVTGNTGLTDSTTNELIVKVLSGYACTKAIDKYYLPSNLPANNDYNVSGTTKTVSICHFSGSSSQKTQLTVSLTSTSSSAGPGKINFPSTSGGNYDGGTNDTIWESDKNCPTDNTICERPTVDNKVITDQTTPVVLTGTIGGGTGSNPITSVKVNSTSLDSTKNGAISYPTSSTWKFTSNSSVTLTAGTYDVVVTNNNSTSSLRTDNTTGELTVTQTPIHPTITSCPTGVYDDTAPAALAGVLGTSTSLNISVKDGSGTLKASGTAGITGSGTSATWGFSLGILPAGTYTVSVIGNTGLTPTTSCSFTVTQRPVAPTIANATTTDLIPAVLTGTSGTSTSLTVTIGGQSVSCPATVDTVSKTWTCTASAAIPAATYTTTVTGTSGSATGQLVVTPSAIPTVDTKTTTDNVAPVLTGTLGSATSLTITVKNSVGGAVVVPSTTVTLTPAQLAAKTWTFTPSSPIAAGLYDVSVQGQTANLKDATTNELTVTTSVVPTVTPVSTTDRIKPTLTGNLGTSTSLAIVIKSSPQVTGNVTVSGSTWSFTSPTLIAAGVYDVEVTGNTGLKDATTNELTVTTCALPLIYDVTGTTCITQVSPTVNTTETTDKIRAQLSGTTGTSTSLNIVVKDVNGVTKDTGTATLNATGWTYSPVLLPGGFYDIIANGDNGLHDDTTNELKVTVTCTLPFTPDSTNTVCVPPTPTVTSKSITIDQQPTTIIGTVGTVGLGQNETFTVTVNNVTYGSSAILVSGTAWQLQLPVLPAGIYEVDAVRGSIHDETHNELEITDKIDICDNGTDKKIERRDWQDWKNGADYYLGQCKAPVCNKDANGNVLNTPAGCTPPLPDPKTDPITCLTGTDAQIQALGLTCVLPSRPTELEPEYVTPITGVVTCADGGTMTDSAILDATIKRAKIVNASTNTTAPESVDSTTLVGGHIKYGVLTLGALDVTVSGAKQVITGKSGQWTGVTLTNAALEDVYIDAPIDYIGLINGKQSVIPACLESDGVTIKSGCYIKAIGGETQTTSVYPPNMATVTNATITNGMIVAGHDEQMNPVRGSMTNGRFDAPVPNAETVITKGRRTHGALVNATVIGAKTTTVGGKTIVTDGVITEATMDFETSPASTFGTVLNATIVGANVGRTNHCFSSGTVGQKGQLNWKEIIK